MFDVVRGSGTRSGCPCRTVRPRFYSRRRYRVLSSRLGLRARRHRDAPTARVSYWPSVGNVREGSFALHAILVEKPGTDVATATKDDGVRTRCVSPWARRFAHDAGLRATVIIGPSGGTASAP